MAYQATPLPVASHKGASLSPGCSTSNPAACRWPEKAANGGLSPWTPGSVTGAILESEPADSGPLSLSFSLSFLCL